MTIQHIFFYGTLMCPEVYRTVTKQMLVATPATLEGYELFSLQDRVYPGIIESTENSVSGLVSLINQSILERLDWFEGREYERRAVQVRGEDGKKLNVWTFVLKNSYYDILLSPDWDYGKFVENDLKDYLS